MSGHELFSVPFSPKTIGGIFRLALPDGNKRLKGFGFVGEGISCLCSVMKGGQTLSNYIDVNDFPGKPSKNYFDKIIEYKKEDAGLIYLNILFRGPSTNNSYKCILIYD
jgi:hypothetical protein